MKKLAFWLLVAVILGCGGGGGGVATSTVTLTGRVLDMRTGGKPGSQVSVQAGSASTLTSTADGSFSLVAAAGSSSVILDPLSNGGPVFTYTFTAGSGTLDLGDLWIGPAQVTVSGRTVDQQTGEAIPGATVEFAGRVATSDASGVFSLLRVAYSPTSQAAFWGVQGQASASGFIPTTFTTEPFTAVDGTVSIGDVRLLASDDITPPPGPVNLWGVVSPTSSAPGTSVTLKQGSTVVRTLTVGTDARYGFWVEPGTYTVSFINGALSAPDETVTLTTTNEVIRRDVALR